MRQRQRSITQTHTILSGCAHTKAATSPQAPRTAPLTQRPQARTPLRAHALTLCLYAALCLTLGAPLCASLSGCGAVIPTVTAIDPDPALSLPNPQSASLRVKVDTGGERVERVWLALHLDASARQPLEASGANTYTLDLSDLAVTDALRPGGGQGVAFIFVAFTSGIKATSAPIPYTIEGVPILTQPIPDDALHPDDAPIDALALAGHTPDIHIPQRTTASIPGSRGQILLSTGDITDDKITTLTVRHGNDVIAQALSLSAGDLLPFQVGAHLYTLRVERVADASVSSVGDDRAHLTLHEGALTRIPTKTLPAESLPAESLPADSPLIESVPRASLGEAERRLVLISLVEDSDVTFMRNGEPHTAQDAAQLIRYKLAEAPANMPLDVCIRTLLSASSQTGQAYQVRLPDGRTIRADDWLLALASTL